MEALVYALVATLVGLVASLGINTHLSRKYSVGKPSKYEVPLVLLSLVLPIASFVLTLLLVK